MMPAADRLGEGLEHLAVGHRPRATDVEGLAGDTVLSQHADEVEQTTSSSAIG